MLTVIVSPSSLYSIWPTESSPSKTNPRTRGSSSIRRYEIATREAANAPGPETASPVVVTRPSLQNTNEKEERKRSAIIREKEVPGTIISSMPNGKYTSMTLKTMRGRIPNKNTALRASTGPTAGCDSFCPSSSEMMASWVQWLCSDAFSSKPTDWLAGVLVSTYSLTFTPETGSMRSDFESSWLIQLTPRSTFASPSNKKGTSLDYLR